MLLIDALDLLASSMDAIYDAAVRVDANALLVQGRFLQAKFGHSSVDLAVSPNNPAKDRRRPLKISALSQSAARQARGLCPRSCQFCVGPEPLRPHRGRDPGQALPSTPWCSQARRRGDGSPAARRPSTTSPSTTRGRPPHGRGDLRPGTAAPSASDPHDTPPGALPRPPKKLVHGAAGRERRAHRAGRGQGRDPPPGGGASGRGAAREGRARRRRSPGTWSSSATPAPARRPSLGWSAASTAALGLLQQGPASSRWDRCGLVAGYLGQTALKTAEVVVSARRGRPVHRRGLQPRRRPVRPGRRSTPSSRRWRTGVTTSS